MSIRKMKVLKVVTILFVMFASITTVKAASATIPTYYVDDGYEVDSSYGWSYKFISGVTSVEVFGFDPLEFYSNTVGYIGFSNGKGYGLGLVLDDDTDYGNCGVVYHNVGSYKGQTISLKITLMSVENYQVSGTITIDGVTYDNSPTIYFSTGAIQINPTANPYIKNAVYKFEFILEDSYVDYNTYETVTVKGHETAYDIDGSASNPTTPAEMLTFVEYSGIDEVYLTSDTYIGVDGLSYYGTTDASDNDSTYAWVTMLFETDSFELMYTSSENARNDSLMSNTPTRRSTYAFGMTQKTVLSFSTPEVFKTVSTDSINGQDSFEYTLDFYIPYQMSDYYYTSLDLEDTYSSVLDIESVKVENDLGEDVTSDFSITYSNGNLSVVANSSMLSDEDSYNVNYTVTVTCKINENTSASDLASYLSEDKTYYTIPNSATLTTNTGSSTDTVDTSLAAGNVEVKYVDKNSGEDIEDTVTIDGYEGKEYETEQKDVTGYVYSSVSGNTTGTMSSSTTTVVYYYIKQSDVTVKYVDYYDQTTEIATGESDTYSQGDTYSTEQKAVEGYTYYTDTNNTSGTVGSEDIEVIYYYKKQSDVTVKYVDYYDQTTEIATSESDTYSQGDTYTTEQKAVEGYTYYTDTGNTSGTVGDEDIEVIYYYKKDTSVTVYYIDKYSGETVATTVTISGVQGTSFETEQRTVSGYVYDSVEGTTLGTMSADSTTVTYYYIKQSDVTVKYVDYYTGEEIETGESETYSQGDAYDTEQKTISGYTFYTDTSNTSGTVADEDIEVVYYYKKQSSVTVKYVDYYNQDTEIATGESDTYLQGDEYSTEQKNISGYVYYTDTGNTSGTVEDEDIEVIYYYKKQSDLITEHIDANSGEKIIDDVVKTYKEGDTWESYAQNFEGYVLVESPDVTTGTMEREDITKTYYYKKISAGLVVKYVDVITGDLLDQETYEGNEKDTITLEEKTFKYYVIYSRPDYTTVDLTVEAQEVIYYYIRIADIDIMGIDKDTGETLYETSKSGLEGDEYTTTPRSIEGYELVTIPDNQNGILYRDSDPVIYEYRRVSSGVTVKYIDIDTGEELADTVTISGLYGDNYETEEKEIEDYELVEVVGDTSGTLEVEEKEVIYYYEKKTGQVIVKYEDIDGNVLDVEEMSDKVGETYETEAEEIEGYKLVKIPDNQTGTYIDGTIEVTYVYKKLGTIIVKFVDTDGNEIAESITTENVVGEEYYLEAPEIDGYTIVGDTYISITYIDGELVFVVEYEKVEENVDTGDIFIPMFLLIAIVSVIGIIYVKKVKKLEI